jgi:hypothetical protein
MDIAEKHGAVPPGFFPGRESDWDYKWWPNGSGGLENGCLTRGVAEWAGLRELVPMLTPTRPERRLWDVPSSYMEEAPLLDEDMIRRVPISVLNDESNMPWAALPSLIRAAYAS